MLDKIEELRRSALAEIELVQDANMLEAYRVKFLARKGLIASMFDTLKDVPDSNKRIMGKSLNDLRSEIQNLYDEKKLAINSLAIKEKEQIDLTLPGRKKWIGSKHPITQTLDEIKRIFFKMGFDVATGPEIEDEYHNFTALNFPPDHPARDMQDTFFISDNVLLRTHTSPVQIRMMENNKPPMRVIIPGRVYRNEAISARSYCLFQQVEGLYVDVGVTFGELKGTLVSFARQFFGEDIKYRFRPSYFPFTEPSAEMDITCFLCKGKGCRVCKYSGWLEILGCGMVHPNLYSYVKYDSSKVTGYAFGLGIDRITMLRYGIDDIRSLYENDVRLLKQF